MNKRDFLMAGAIASAAAVAYYFPSQLLNHSEHLPNKEMVMKLETIARSDLEEILKKSAKDLGWEIKVKDDYKEFYENGSVQKKYLQTGAELSKGNANIRLAIYPLGEYTNEPLGKVHSIKAFYPAALDAELIKYFNAVSQNLPK